LISLGAAYCQLSEPERAVEIFDHALTNPELTYNQAANIVQVYSVLGANYFDRLETALKKMADLAPNIPEAHYDLAAMEAVHGETAAAIEQLRTALQLSTAQRKTNPSAKNLLLTNLSDRRFDRLRNLPEYQKIISQ
jgi:Tfp pilus assembly protein PilF